MRKILTTALLALTFGANAQTLNPDNYEYPVRNVAGLCSSNFGEMRPDHFHSGVDIKTDGVEGKPVVAVADGYISRIVVQPSGYGQALYVTHPDGTTSVYGHLSRFRSDIDSLVRTERYRRQRNSVDIFLNEEEYPVRRGETIALSGNTGNSFGPHLHFEIRETATQRTLNLIAQGVIRVADTQKPIVNAIYYVAVDSVGGMALHSKPRRTALRRTASGHYVPADGKPVKVAPAGYFILDVTDRKDNVWNRFGIYRVSESIDGKPVFEYRMDGFTFDASRYCNAVSYYPIQLTARSEMIRLACLEGNRRDFYTVLDDNGLVRMADGGRHTVRIEAEDDCHNISAIEFEIEPGFADAEFTAAAEEMRRRIAEGDPSLLVIDRTCPFTTRCGDIEVTIPEGSLYESVPFHGGPAGVAAPADSTIMAISPVYEVMDSDTPLQKSMNISIRAFVPYDIRPHVALATITAKGRPAYVGGKYDNGAITARTRRFGRYYAVADTVAPTVVPRFINGSDMRKYKAISFDVDDNFSGIGEYSMFIDGEWVPVDYSPIKGRMTHSFDHLRYPRDTRHTVVINVTDNCGNRTVWRGEFTR